MLPRKSIFGVICSFPYFYFVRIKLNKVLGFPTNAFCLGGAMKQWLWTAVSVDCVSELSLAQSSLWRFERLLLFLLSHHSIARAKVCMCKEKKKGSEGDWAVNTAEGVTAQCREKGSLQKKKKKRGGQELYAVGYIKLCRSEASKTTLFCHEVLGECSL